MVTRSRLLPLVLFVGLLTSSHAFEWKSCAEEKVAFDVVSVTLSPEPVSPGSTAIFSINATSDTDIQAGEITMLVQYGGFPIWTQSDDLCQKMPCPAAPGPVSVVFEQLFPIITPPGQYVVTLKGSDNALAELFCVQVTFQVLPVGVARSGVQQVALAARRLLAA